MSGCGKQWSEKKKFGADECFSCLKRSRKFLLEPGHVYEACTPVVQGKTKNAPFRPMTGRDDCIRAWVNCEIDASEWDEACMQHVYPNAEVYKERANWPCDEKGNPIFTVDDIDYIAQSADCCRFFDELQTCEQAPEYLKEIEKTNQAK